MKIGQNPLSVQVDPLIAYQGALATSADNDAVWNEFLALAIDHKIQGQGAFFDQIRNCVPSAAGDPRYMAQLRAELVKSVYGEVSQLLRMLVRGVVHEHEAPLMALIAERCAPMLGLIEETAWKTIDRDKRLVVEDKLKVLHSIVELSASIAGPMIDEVVRRDTDAVRARVKEKIVVQTVDLAALLQGGLPFDSMRRYLPNDHIVVGGRGGEPIRGVVCGGITSEGQLPVHVIVDDRLQTLLVDQETISRYNRHKLGDHFHLPLSGAELSIDRVGKAGADGEFADGFAAMNFEDAVDAVKKAIDAEHLAIVKGQATPPEATNVYQPQVLTTVGIKNETNGVRIADGKETAEYDAEGGLVRMWSEKLTLAGRSVALTSIKGPNKKDHDFEYGDQEDVLSSGDVIDLDGEVGMYLLGCDQAGGEGKRIDRPGYVAGKATASVDRQMPMFADLRRSGMTRKEALQAIVSMADRETHTLANDPLLTSITPGHRPSPCTTIALAMRFGKKLYTAHAGDSRIVVASRDGTIKWSSQGHALAEELARLTGRPLDQFQKYATVVTRSIGPSGVTPIEINEVDIEDDDLVLVFTDGVDDMDQLRDKRRAVARALRSVAAQKLCDIDDVPATAFAKVVAKIGLEPSDWPLIVAMAKVPDEVDTVDTKLSDIIRTSKNAAEITDKTRDLSLARMSKKNVGVDRNAGQGKPDNIGMLVGE